MARRSKRGRKLPKARRRVKPSPARRTPRRRKARKPSFRSVVKQAHVALRLEMVTVYENRKGEVVPKETKGARRVEYVAQVGARGNVLRMIPSTTRQEIIKVVAPGTMEHPAEAFRSQQGLIFYGLATTNVLTALKRGAKRIEITIKGRDGRDKVKRIKLSLQPEKDEKLQSFLIGNIVRALHERGFRTQYTFQMMQDGATRYKRGRKQGEMVHYADEAAWLAQGYEALKDVAITVVIKR